MHRFNSPATSLFFTLLCSILLSGLFPAPEINAAPKDTITIQPAITISLPRQPQPTVLHKAALLPFLSEDPKLAASLNAALYKALNTAKKYTLLSPETVRERLADTPLPQKNQAGQLVAIGRLLKARGVINGQIRLIHPSGTIEPPLFDLNLQMTDAQTGTTVWSIHSRQSSTLDPLYLMTSIVQKLINAMTCAGDIFSPVLPRPTIISTKGEIRRIKIMIKPDQTFKYASYRILASPSRNAIFRTRQTHMTRHNNTIIFNDNHLKDDTTYYYTVIGIAENGLASIPLPPTAVTTVGPPQPVRQLRATGNNLRQIHLTWQRSQDTNVSGYTLYRAQEFTGPFTKVASIDTRNQQSYVDYGSGRYNSYGTLADNTVYFYSITARNIVGIESRKSPVIAVKTKGAPPPPVGIRTLDRQPQRVPLSWHAVEDKDIRGYLIFRSTSPQGPFEKIDFVRGQKTEHYTDDGSWTTPLRDNTTYFYRIQSVNVLDVTSQDSVTVSATTKQAPSAVRGVVCTTNLVKRVTLNWQANLENNIVTYEIFRGTPTEELTKVASLHAPATRYTDKNLKDGITYWYAVRAIDSDHLQGIFMSPVCCSTRPLPPTPTQLSATLTSKGILLKWQRTHTGNLSFEIVRTGFLMSKVGTTSKPDFLYITAVQPGEKFSFQVRSIDQDGLKSHYSQPVHMAIPKEP